MEAPDQKNKSNTFGIISIVVAIFSLFVPRIFISIVLIVDVVFMVLAYIKDKSKIYSFISLCIILFIGFLELKESAKGIQTYSIRYQVTCTECDASYTNETGGTNKIEKIKGSWETTITAKGDDFIYLSAQNGRKETEVSVMIYINGKLYDKVTSKGKYAIADVSCNPKEIK